MKKGIYKLCQKCGDKFYIYPYLLKDKTRGKYCSLRCKYRAISLIYKGQGQPKWLKGIKLSKKDREKISLALKGKLPKNFYEMQKKGWETCKGKSPWNKGLKGSVKANSGSFKKGNIPKSKGNGIKCKEAELIRSSLRYREWRAEVFKRDKWTCQICGYKGNKLHADHIKPFSLFPSLRFDIKNGRTLCFDCHKKTPTYFNNHMNKSDFYLNLSEEVAEIGGLTITTEISDNTKQYSMFNDGSTECEVSEFLYGFVRMLKPTKILESGTYKGISSSFMALALKKNGKGIIETLEIEEQHINTSKQLWEKLGITKWVQENKISSLEYIPNGKYQILFLDSEPNLRFNELIRFFPYLDEGGYAFIHDLPRGMCQGNINPDLPNFKSWPYGDLQPEIKQWVKEDKLRPFHFETPRGLTCFYKVHRKDYLW